MQFAEFIFAKYADVIDSLKIILTKKPSIL